jgi:CheY-like chemotaxis protein
MATVLVVDDEESILGIVADLVEEMGHRALRAANGREALAVVQTTLPDLVLADVMMPYVDGLQLCEALKTDAATAHIVVVLMSAIPSARRQAGGADGFVSKPFSLDDIESAIARGLDRVA